MRSGDAGVGEGTWKRRPSLEGWVRADSREEMWCRAGVAVLFSTVLVFVVGGWGALLSFREA